ncbi:MAG: hypothetical protein M1828_004118 [Chrysothrix sp. TS-e1954]|nr:MAG: hypothetical protein M1828_004118 [Chrysothrix sp. TS-e1954]
MAQQPPRKQLYVFDLPSDILSTLQLKTQQEQPSADGLDGSEDVTPDDSVPCAEDEAGPKATSCALCKLSFANLQDQRSHVRSDLHGYNLKQKVRGSAAVSEQEFEKLVGDLDESLSGSDSSESDSDNEDDIKDKANGNVLNALLRKQAHISETIDDSFTSRKRKRGAGKPPLLWFGSSILPTNSSLGFYRAMFTQDEQSDEKGLVDVIRRKQLSPKPPPRNPEDGGVALPNNNTTGPHVFLCMIGGGHFAAMIVSLAPKLGKKHGADERQATVLAHKTFHRYTTRRKQGGAQSANDSAKGAAHSAGSSLRRYNETALIAEVRELLGEWKELIDTSSLLFIRATGSTNRRTIFGPYEGQVLRLNDPRLRGFPFSTRRATQSELMRCFVEVTRVKISDVDEAAIAAAKAREEAAAIEAKETASRAKAASEKKPVVPERNEEEEAALLYTSQIEALVRRSKAPALLSYLTSNSLSPNFKLYPHDSRPHHHAPTALHMAASLSAPALVHALLVKADADPTIHNGEGKTACDLAGDPATKNSFRIARYDIGEDRWLWALKARVAEPISKEAVEARKEHFRREEARRDEEQRKIRLDTLKEEERIREEQNREKKLGKPKTIGTGRELTVQEKREEEGRGMTHNAKMKLEREKRARAAEARFKK